MNIILCGFMGCGKSSIGWRLAKLTGYKFVDIDKVIEEDAGMTVREIFAQKGENAFRSAETQAVKELSKRDNLVIATGGGTVMNPENVDTFHEGGGKILFLDVPVAALQERLKRDVRRPLLQRPDRREFIYKFHRERHPKYKDAADFVIRAGAPAIVVARNIAALVTELEKKEQS